jgi:hypothetical protein
MNQIYKFNKQLLLVNLLHKTIICTEETIFGDVTISNLAKKKFQHQDSHSHDITHLPFFVV